MNKLCLPSSVGKLCQVLSSVGIQGRFLSEQVTRLQPSTTSLPITALLSDSHQTRPNQASVTSSSPVYVGDTRLSIHQVSSVSNPSSQQVIGLNTAFDSLFITSVKQKTKPRLFQGLPITGLEYICPSNINTSNTIILDQAVAQNRVIIDCPTPAQVIHDISLPELRINEITDPVPNNANKIPPAKEARQILKIRRRKMNRHLLKKLKKRMEFTLRKQKLLMKRKKEAIFEARLAAIRRSGVEFDPRQFIEQELETARKGGFQIDIFQSKR